MTTDLRPQRARQLAKNGLRPTEIADLLEVPVDNVRSWVPDSLLVETPEPAPSTATADELAAMHIVVAALEKLTPNARQRVTNWAHTHLEDRVTPAPVQSAASRIGQVIPHVWAGVTPSSQFEQGPPA